MTQVDNPFSIITNRKYPDDFMIKPSTFTVVPQSNDNIQQEPVSVDVYISPKKAKKTKNKTVIGLSVATVTLIGSCVAFMLFGGGFRGINRSFNNLSKLINKKVNSAKIDTDGVTSFSNYLIATVGKFLGTFAEKTQFINNFTSFKDVLFKKIMNNRLTGCVTGKIHNLITSLYEKLANKTLKDSYKNTKSLLYDAFGYSDALKQGKYDTSKKYTVNGVEKTVKEIINDIESKEKVISGTYNGKFTVDIKTRYEEYQKKLKEIVAKFSKMKETFLNKKVYKDFLADTEFSPTCSNTMKEISTERNSISHSVSDLYNSVDEILNGILIKTKIKDKDTIRLINNTRRELLKNLKNDKLDAASIKQIIEKLREPLEKQENKELLNLLNDAIKSCDDYFAGEVEHILDLYKMILPEDKFKIIKSKYYKAIKSLDKSITLETQEYSSKLRDLALGSAPTDVLTIVGGLASLAYGLGVADNNQERVSISLKYGIPAVIGIAANLYCNARLYAGTKGLLFGVVSSLLANKIGSYVDEKYNNSSDSEAKNTLKNV